MLPGLWFGQDSSARLASKNTAHPPMMAVTRSSFADLQGWLILLGHTFFDVAGQQLLNLST
jgi:hypothetical protein